MKKTAMTLLTMPILITLLILGMTSQAVAAGNRDVLIMTCSSGPMPMGGTLQVVGVNRSAGANDVPINVADPFDPTMPGDDCAQALANLLNAGFTISNNQGSDFTLIYTLTRTGH